MEGLRPSPPPRFAPFTISFEVRSSSRVAWQVLQFVGPARSRMVSKETKTATGAVEFALDEGRVRIIDGPDRGRSFRLGEAAVLGTDPTCDIRLTDECVSRRHCRIQLGQRGFWVTDLQSHNGTLYDGAHVNEIAVAPGALLQIGTTHLLLEAPRTRGLIVPPSSQSRFGELVGGSLRMRQVYALLEMAAQNDTTVLLEGETGTGKELAARAIHEASERSKGPFVVFDCGTTQIELVCSQLFGHVAGAFTGATKDHVGVVQAAAGGTLFIDEVAELPSEIQPALLRLCERKTICRVGSTEQRQVDVRIIVATNRQLSEEVVKGTFRRDLYYRLQVLPIAMPPLRTRKEDIAELCETILADMGHGDVRIDPAALSTLMSHDWPGNARELRNVLQRALAAKRNPEDPLRPIVDHGTPTAVPGTQESFLERKRVLVDSFEREFLSNLMRQHQGNIRAASRAAGIERSQLKRRLRKHGLI
jgi:DNA-binding NtrC family response regulator